MVTTPVNDAPRFMETTINDATVAVSERLPRTAAKRETYLGINVSSKRVRGYLLLLVLGRLLHEKNTKQNSAVAYTDSSRVNKRPPDFSRM